MYGKTRSRKMQDHDHDYETDKLRGKNFIHPRHVRVTGDIKLKGVLVVGGNLTVQGDLEAEAVYCFGSLVVGGSVKRVCECFVGRSIEVGGDLDVVYIENAHSLEEMADRLQSEPFAPELDQDDDDDVDAISLWLAPDIRGELEADADMNWAGLEVRVGGSFDCYGLQLKGDVSVGGLLDVDAGEINDSLTVDVLQVEDELQVYGHLVCNSLSVGGELYASELTCHGNAAVGDLTTEDEVRVLGILEAGNITSGGNIVAGRWIAAYGAINAREYVKAGESVVSETAILTGKNHGIFAGLCVARSEWPTRGFVSAPTRPKNILSGKFVEGKVCDDLES